jgi:hypothetical protein
MRFYLCLLVFFFPAGAWAASSVEQPERVSIDFLYINANAGEAAGGHTALRLGDSVFHYQFFPDASFLLVRESWDSFRFLYNDLHNRSIAIASLPFDLSVAVKIRNHFTELLIAQQNFIDAFEALHQEKQLVGQLVNGNFQISVDCLGFFNKKEDPVLQPILAREFFESEFWEIIVNEADEAFLEAVRVLNDGERPGKSFQEILAWREALRVLVNGQTLKPVALIRPMEEEKGLSVHEKEILESFGDNILHALQELLHSKRPDRGEALLLQIARYLAVQQSLTKGSLFTLDPFFKEIRVVELTSEDMEKGQLESLKKDLLKQASNRRELFFQEMQHPEIAYSLMETSRARAWELAKINDTNRSVRILVKVTLPTRPGVVSFEFPGHHRKNLEKMLKRLEQELSYLQKRREELYGYNLIWRNCATELIRSLNSTFSDKKSGRKELGGWLEPDHGLVFIPFLFYEQSVSAYSLQNKVFLQGRRLRNLNRLYEQENDFLVWLRESNTLSSTIYQSRSKDTPFLFFTDDSLFLRPVQGVFNILYAALYGVAGVINLPFDGGDSFNQAARGVFYSLPELLFGNIRKGSYSTGENEAEHRE